MKIRGPRPKLWRGYRNCDRCTRWRPVSDFTVYKTRTGYEQIKGECDYCKRQRERARYEKLSQSERRDKGKRANRQAQKRRDKQLSHIERQRVILDKQNHEIEELYDRLRALQSYYPVRGEINGTAVDIIPFRMWLLRMNREGGYNTSELAAEIGQDEARVRRWLDGFEWKGLGREPVPIRAIEVNTVDAIGVAMDDPGLLTRLYPLKMQD